MSTKAVVFANCITCKHAILNLFAIHLSKNNDFRPIYWFEPYLGKPRDRHTTTEMLLFKPLSQTFPHLPYLYTSNRP